MSEVIRDVVIRMRLEADKARAEAPQLKSFSRGFEEQTKAATEAKKATNESARAVTEHARVNEDFGRRSFRSFEHAGRGVLQVTRGVALMSMSGQKDIQKLLESFIVLEGAMSLAKGLGSLAKFAATLHPVGRAVAAVATVATIGAAAWSRYAGSIQESIKAANEARDALRKLEADRAREANRRAGEDQSTRDMMGDLRISLAGNDTDRQRRVKAEADRAAREAARASAEERRIQRGTAKQPGAGFGETSPELQKLLEEFGGFRGIKERRGSLLSEQETATRRQIQQQEELRRLQREELGRNAENADRMRSALVVGTLSAGPLSSGLALGANQFAGLTSQAQFEGRQKFEQEFAKTFEALLGTLEKVNQRRVELERSLGEAHVK